MRPPQKAGGNDAHGEFPDGLDRFNEAPAKGGGEFSSGQPGAPAALASMRPPQKAGGNQAAVWMGLTDGELLQ